MKTLSRARGRAPGTNDEWELCRHMWEQVERDIKTGRAGPPVDVRELDLDSILLVDSFGIWECHGENGCWKTRTIRDFLANFVNDYAWLPQRMKYDGYDSLQHALTTIKQRLENVGKSLVEVSVGKADFKSAFKTLPPSDSQTWLCWALAFDPVSSCLKAVPLWSHVFGNIGSVAAWFRTVKAIQAILHVVFKLPILFYVDDGFWVGTEHRTISGLTITEWIGDLFARVATLLLGWELDPQKAAAGRQTVVLGLQITVREKCTFWRLAPTKRFNWIQDLRYVLKLGRLSPGLAAKFAGRFAFLNAHVFNRIGRALLRPIIWRQRHSCRGDLLTRRLRFALVWFLSLLEKGLSKEVQLVPQVKRPVVLLYSDAEQNGGVGGVAQLPDGELLYIHGRLPKQICRLLHVRKTNIVAFELLAALVSMLAFGKAFCGRYRIMHFIDSTSALACLVRGYSSKTDLCLLAGRFWFEACGLHLDCRLEYVNTRSNIADGPSRGDFSLMHSLGANEMSDWHWPSFDRDLSDWLRASYEAHRAVQH